MIFGWWYTLQRRTDMSVLWPACKKYARTLDHAKAAFYSHVVKEPAWTKHYSEKELRAYIDRLE